MSSQQNLDACWYLRGLVVPTRLCYYAMSAAPQLLAGVKMSFSVLTSYGFSLDMFDVELHMIIACNLHMYANFLRKTTSSRLMPGNMFPCIISNILILEFLCWFYLYWWSLSLLQLPLQFRIFVGETHCCAVLLGHCWLVNLSGVWNLKNACCWTFG